MAEGVAQPLRRAEEPGRPLRRPADRRQGGHPGEPVGQHLPGAELPPQRQARREPGGGPGPVAPVAGHEPEVVERQRGVERVVEFAVHRQRVLEDRRRLRRVALPVDRPAEDVAPHPGDPPAVAQRLEDRLGLRAVDRGLVVVPLRQGRRSRAGAAPGRCSAGRPGRARAPGIRSPARAPARSRPGSPPAQPAARSARARTVAGTVALAPGRARARASRVPPGDGCGRARTRPATRPAAAPLPRRRSAPARRGPPAGCRGRPRSGPATPGTPTRRGSPNSVPPGPRTRPRGRGGWPPPRRWPPVAPARTRGPSPASRTGGIPARSRRGPPSAARSATTRLWSTSDPTPSSTDPAPSPHDRLGRLQGEAADEDGQPAEERLLLGREQVVAPGDGVAHRPQPGGQVARPARRAAAAAAPAAPAAPPAAAGRSAPRPARSPAAARRGGGRSRPPPARSPR